jgi:hypothetical protein
MNAKDVTKLILDIKSTNPVLLQIKGRRTDAPRAIRSYNSKTQFVPDFVARYTSKRDYYAVEKSIDEKDIHLFVFKWILFAAESRKTSGKFFLVIPKAKELMCKKLIQEKLLDIELIAL